MGGRIKLTDSIAGAEIEVGGQRIEKGVRSLTIEAVAGGVPRISLELGVAEAIDIEGNVTLRLTGDEEKALRAMGWTPPAGG